MQVFCPDNYNLNKAPTESLQKWSHFICAYLMHFTLTLLRNRKKNYTKKDTKYKVIVINIKRQPYHSAAQDRLPTEAKQGWAWSIPGWETSWEN